MGVPPPGVWERNLVASLDIVDAVTGGDRKATSGARHEVVEPFGKPYDSPVREDDTARKLRESGGVAGLLAEKAGEGDAGYEERRAADTQEILAFLGRFDADNLSSKIIRATQGLPSYRATFVRNLVHALDVMRETALSAIDGVERPSFQQRYQAATLFPHKAKLFPDEEFHPPSKKVTL